MALYFTKTVLKDENGKVFLISYRSLLEECLKHSMEELSIYKIVFETIERLTGEKVKKHEYNASLLFRWLEKNIQKSDVYISRKKQLTQKSLDYKESIKNYQERKKHMKAFNVELDRKEAKIQRRYYRSSFKR